LSPDELDKASDTPAKGNVPQDQGTAGPPPERILLNPEEWKEPAGRKVIGEYHKEGLPEGAASGDADLDSFEQYWKEKGQSKLKGEYHKEGAPYMEAPSEWDGHGSRLGRPSDKASEKMAHDSRERARHGDGDEGHSRGEPSGGNGIGRGFDAGGPAGAPAAQPLIERVLDVTTIEVLTFAMFRAIFGRGVRIPLRIEGVIDMEIVAKDKDIVLNTNELQFEVPELSVWRFIFAYKGKPVIEYGRGVKNRIKIHRFRLFLVLLAMWWGGRKKRIALAKAANAAGEAKARYAAGNGGTKKNGGAKKK
jgi:hypothetical protein